MKFRFKKCSFCKIQMLTFYFQDDFVFIDIFQYSTNTWIWYAKDKLNACLLL